MKYIVWFGNPIGGFRKEAEYPTEKEAIEYCHKANKKQKGLGNYYCQEEVGNCHVKQYRS